MTDPHSITILVAEDNEISREMMSDVFKTQGYNVIGAIDGGSAIRVIQDNNIDLAIVDINMVPEGGFAFMKYLIVQGIDLPVVIVTGDYSSDVLNEAQALGISQVIQKPVKPDRLIEIARRILKRRGLSSKPLAVSVHKTKFSPEELMDKTIALARANKEAGKGGPFGALVSDETGKILGKGANGLTSRADPTAHAEVMAIRQAAEKLGQTDLSNCTLFCSSEPTMVGKALITSVGIGQVYYGLSHEDMSAGTKPAPRKKLPDTIYSQLGHEAALTLFDG